MICSAAVSTRPSADDVGQELAERLTAGAGGTREPPDLVVVFASPRHRDDADSLLGALSGGMSPRHVVGCTAEGIIAGGRELVDGDAAAAIALYAPGAVLETFHAEFEPTEGGGTLSGLPLERAAKDKDSALVVFGDPYSFPMDAVLRHSNHEMRGARIIGGMASAGGPEGGNRLFHGDDVHDSGCVGALLGGPIAVRPVVSQGCRPIGSHAVVTKCRNNVIEELGGRPALARLEEMLQGLPARDLELVRHALHVGRVIDEYKSSFSRGDFLIRSVIGFDPKTGAIAINDAVRLGHTVQFQVRDPASATEDLEHLLDAESAAAATSGGAARGALLFSCNGRGRRMFSTPDHDASAVSSRFGPLPLAGFFAAGEIGPVGGQNFLHGFTASIALLCERSAAG